MDSSFRLLQLSYRFLRCKIFGWGFILIIINIIIYHQLVRQSFAHSVQSRAEECQRWKPTFEICDNIFKFKAIKGKMVGNFISLFDMKRPPCNQSKDRITTWAYSLILQENLVAFSKTDKQCYTGTCTLRPPTGFELTHIFSCSVIRPRSETTKQQKHRWGNANPGTKKK